MFERTRRGLAIAKSSLDILLRHPRLIILPVLSTVTLIVAVLLIGTTMFFGQMLNFNWPFYVLGFLVLLLALSFVGVFFNCALVSCVLDAFAGRRVSLRAGLAMAMTRLPHIFAWAIFATTVGFVIRLVQDNLRKLGLLGALIGGAAGLSWAMVTFLVVPVLVAEDLGPADAVKRSTQIVKQTWGNVVGVETGLGLIILVGLLPPIGLIAWVNGGTAPSVHAGTALIAAGAAAAVYFVVLAAFLSTLDVIFRTGVYAYATTGQIPGGVDSATFENSFRR